MFEITGSAPAYLVYDPTMQLFSSFVQKGEVTGIKINDITYKNIKGTSATTIATKFDCSSRNSCSGIRLEDVNLSFQNKPAQSLCTNANGISFGNILPDSCLLN
ncbi:hypothetical protein F8388_011742 [Cannabis sativa]|uniref:Polygalacturonase n=1 Tax=Cannabis sativa TaxID=3483 RepID=A0A7J6FGP4_CANSA|nr:hypothetical protein F8388_011742 [Cannabis sativa]